MSADVPHEAPSDPPRQAPKTTRPPRPNYNKIHANPLPLVIHPLPPLIPHNPLSLAHLAIAWLSQLILRPSSHKDAPYVGYFSPETHSVQVTDERSVRALWEHGFFGKGSLSRSEPSWLDREKKRLGILAQETSEEVTRKRREERKDFKRERAWKERAAIEETLRREKKLGESNELPRDAAGVNHTQSLGLSNEEKCEAAEMLPTPDGMSSIGSGQKKSRLPAQGRHLPPVEAQNQEHLQLSMEEALFLTHGLGVLKVYSLTTKKAIALQELLRLSVSHATFPPLSLTEIAPLPLDDNFIVSYVAYHHFRTLGWVVRPGVKFAVDLLLYNRGPVFSHAEFAVIVLPDYSHSHWRDAERAAGKPWHWLHMVNRVQSQVRKTLVLCYVWIPPPVEGENLGNVDLKEVLGRYRVREVVLKRWIPNRSRD